jgi:hypothetical protein
MEKFDEMQELFKQRGMDHMLIRSRTSAEMAELCAKIDQTFAEGETRLQIAEGKREDKRVKKQERRKARQADICLIVPDERRSADRRGKRRF